MVKQQGSGGGGRGAGGGAPDLPVKAFLNCTGRAEGGVPRSLKDFFLSPSILPFGLSRRGLPRGVVGGVVLAQQVARDGACVLLVTSREEFVLVTLHGACRAAAEVEDHA